MAHWIRQSGIGPGGLSLEPENCNALVLWSFKGIGDGALQMANGSFWAFSLWLVLFDLTLGRNIQGMVFFLSILECTGKLTIGNGINN